MERKLTREEYIIAHNLKKKLIEKNYDCSEIQNGKHYFEPVLDCSIDSMISFCNKAKKELVGKKNIRFCLDGIDYEDCEVKLVYDDLETDEEFEKRVSREYDNYLDTYEDKARLEKKDDLEYHKKLTELKKLYGKE